MAEDRFVTGIKPMPTYEQVGMLIEDYLGAAATEVKWHEEARRFIVGLHGKYSHPFRRVGPSLYELDEERFLEVYIGDDYIDVMTRHGDRYTGTVANTLAELVKLCWGGRLEN